MCPRPWASRKGAGSPVLRVEPQTGFKPGVPALAEPPLTEPQRQASSSVLSPHIRNPGGHRGTERASDTQSGTAGRRQPLEDQVAWHHSLGLDAAHCGIFPSNILKHPSQGPRVGRCQSLGTRQKASRPGRHGTIPGGPLCRRQLPGWLEGGSALTSPHTGVCDPLIPALVL